MAMADGMTDEGKARGDLALWIVVWGELVLFGVLLLGLMVQSALHPAAAAAARLALDARLASLGVLVLITGGWLAAEAVLARHATVRRAELIAAGLLGLAYAGLKLVEGRALLLAAGDGMARPFLDLAAVVSGLHLAHVLALAGVLFILAWRPRPAALHWATTLWQVINLVGLVMFPIVYLG
jgi:nitric oxide reductase NorE protein